MLKKIEEHIFQGMQRDVSISKQKSEFLWDANNIRLTSRHGDTLLSMTNERGTKKIDNIIIKGVVLGYCVLNDYLTIFTKDSNYSAEDKGPDYIYRIQKSKDNFDLQTLYNGNLNFNLNKPIECLGVYENEDIQKVYWTDGINQPRVINITKQLVVDTTYNDTSFDFIPTLKLKDIIHVKKIADSSGLFPAGVVQYAVTYFNKYGLESNISAVSPLIPTSYTLRAGSPEETIGNAFKITIENPDTQFEFLRLYSIFRSSKNTTPVCKRVADVRLGYGENMSDQVVTSNDVQSINYAKLNNIYFKVDDDEFRELNDTNVDPGAEDITINDNIYHADSYYHFNKEDFNQLLIKADVYRTDNGNYINKTMYITWDGCTDIYIIKGTQISPSSIIAVGGTLHIKIASTIYYLNTSFIHNNSITITDNNTIGESVDSNELLFVGGEEITAETITQKDGTMFLGNITIRRPQIKGNYDLVDQHIPNYIDDELNKDQGDINMILIIREGTDIELSHRECLVPIAVNSQSYKWGNTLNAITTDRMESTNIAGFKWKEHYRLGLQFQYKTGKWSQPVFIDDVITDVNTQLNDNVDHRPQLSIDQDTKYYKLTIPTFTGTLDARVGRYMLQNDYKRVRAVVCFPTESDQLILCQGLLNPTVYSIAGRVNHTPDIQSSWYFRPVPEVSEEQNESVYEGGIVQYEHNYTLYGGEHAPANDNDKYRPTRRDEIQGVPFQFGNMPASSIMNLSNESNFSIDIGNRASGQTTEDDKLLTHTFEDSRDLTNIFAVDCQYLTFHSPEFEFNDAFRNLDMSTLKCRKCGNYMVQSNQGDIHIMTSSSPIYSDAPGFYHKVIQTDNSSRINADLFYKDGTVYYTDKEAEPIKYLPDTDNLIRGFMVYPWHRTGSLNNDCVRPDGQGGRTAVLAQKKLSNLMFFNNQYSDGPDLNAIDMQVYNSDQISLIRINGKNYFGNVDQVINPCFTYLIGYSDSRDEQARLLYPDTDGWAGLDKQERDLYSSNDPIYMKYKSTPHCVVYLNEDLSQTLNPNNDQDNPQTGLCCAEMYRTPLDTDFGGRSAMAIHNNLWYPAGPATEIKENNNTEIEYMYGDTYYQRYDCLKTYPFTDEDINSIIEIGSFMVETKINLDGRYDKNRANILNFMLNPTNFNLINLVYSQMDNFFNYRILDEDYYALNKYPTMITWTGYKNNAAEIDSWTNITLASTLEMDGIKGKVNAVRVSSDQLYCFQDDAVGQILFNSRVLISPSDGVPIEISNNYKVDGNRYVSTTIGCKNKWTIAEGVDGLYFIDDNTKALYQLSGQGQIKPISTPLNMSYWFINQDTSTQWVQYYRKIEEQDEISESYQRGIRCFYDNANADLYICTPDKTLCYSEKLGLFVSFFDYHHVQGMFNMDSQYYALNYNDDETTSLGVNMWSMFQGPYNLFFNKIYATDFTFISNENPLNDKIFTNVEIRGDFRWWTGNEVSEDFNSSNHMINHRKMFDSVRVWNEYQDTWSNSLKFTNNIPSNTKKKFRIWRIDIPRDKQDRRQRIRNTWTKIKFTMNTPISLDSLIGKTSDEFIDANGNSLNLNQTTTTFTYNNGKIFERSNTGNQQLIATYTMDGDKVIKESNGLFVISSVYRRKLYDMEIHDVGVVYFL